MLHPAAGDEYLDVGIPPLVALYAEGAKGWLWDVQYPLWEVRSLQRAEGVPKGSPLDPSAAYGRGLAGETRLIYGDMEYL